MLVLGDLVISDHQMRKRSGSVTSPTWNRKVA